MKLDFDQIIIGSGVAGMTAAIYLKRAGKNVALIEKSAPGGQINKSYKVENYPGFREIDGPSLSMNVYEQTMGLGIDYLYGDVLDIVDHGEYFTVITDEKSYNCKKILIATGRESKNLPALDFEKFIGHGISYCALCDGNFFKGKDVIVVGGGNSAFEDALYLSGICKSVTILVRSKVRAEKALTDVISSKDNVTVLLETEIKEIFGEESPEGVLLNNGDEIACDGIFIAVGSIPNLSFLKSISLKMEDGYVVVNNHMETSHKNIYAVGDVIRKDVYQLATAVGEAATAAYFM